MNHRFQGLRVAARAIAGTLLAAGAAAPAWSVEEPALRVERRGEVHRSIEEAARKADDTATGRAPGGPSGAAPARAGDLEPGYEARMVHATRNELGAALLQRYLLRNADLLALLNQDEAYLIAWYQQRVKQIVRGGAAACDGSGVTMTPDELREQLEFDAALLKATGRSARAPQRASAAELAQSRAVLERSMNAADWSTVIASDRADSAEMRCRGELLWTRAALAAPAPHRLRLLRERLFDSAVDPDATITPDEVALARRLVRRLPVEPPPAYPPVAAAIGAEATLKVALSVDASGAVKQAAIVSRRISVPGLLGLEPLIFERWFDAASLQLATARSYAPPAGTTSAGARTVEVDIPWQLRR
mgnify:CR=1 FL=1